MNKDSKARKVLTAIAKALKTGLPISVLTVGLSSCDKKPLLPERTPGTQLGHPQQEVVTGKYTSKTVKDNAEVKAPPNRVPPNAVRPLAGKPADPALTKPKTPQPPPPKK